MLCNLGKYGALQAFGRIAERVPCLIRLHTYIYLYCGINIVVLGMEEVITEEYYMFDKEHLQIVKITFRKCTRSNII